MHDFKGFLIKLTIDIIIVGAILLGVIAAFMGTKAHAGSEWNEGTQKKYDNLVSLGFNKTFAKSIITECKIDVINPVLCIKLGSSIAGAESSMANRCYKNNCMGMGGGSFNYSSIEEGVRHWVKQYRKWWYNQKNPDAFYPLRGKVAPTRYCTDEHSSGSKKGCPNGNRHAWNVWNKLNF